MMSEIECERWLQEVGTRMEERLSFWLWRMAAPDSLRAVMQYAVLGGGKRLRPAMLLAVAEPPPSAVALDAACAVECLHCYSLVHDDLPCMDAAATRRGKPACHIQYGEAQALLGGDCLHSLAFEILSACALPTAVRMLAQAAGGGGMGGGQCLDLQAAAADEPALRRLHELKTGALFDCAIQLGALCRGVSCSQETARLREFAAAFGLLFQIANDIKDAEADAALDKTTYITVLGAAAAVQHARAAHTRAVAALDGQYPRLTQMSAMLLAAIG